MAEILVEEAAIGLAALVVDCHTFNLLGVGFLRWSVPSGLRWRSSGGEVWG
jgi:hypothetical protein